LRVEIGTTFSARCLVDFVGRRVQSSDSEGSSNAAGREEKRREEIGTAAMVIQPVLLTSSQSPGGSGTGSGTGKESMGVTKIRGCVNRGPEECHLSAIVRVSNIPAGFPSMQLRSAMYRSHIPFWQDISTVSLTSCGRHTVKDSWRVDSTNTTIIQSPGSRHSTVGL